MRPAFCYMGGKALLVKTLLRLIPRNIETYCEVFGGAGNLLLSKPSSNVEVWNDLDGELANLMRVIKTRPRLLIRTARRFRTAAFGMNGCSERSKVAG